MKPGIVLFKANPKPCFQGSLGTSLCLSQWVRPQQFLLVKVDDLDSGEEDEVEVRESKKPKLNPDEIESPDLKGADKECYDLMKSLQEREAKIASGQDEAKKSFNVLEMDELKCLHVGTSARPILDEDDLAKCTTAAAEQRAGRVPASGPVPRRCFTLASLLDIPHIQSDPEQEVVFTPLAARRCNATSVIMSPTVFIP